jgi:uncharacterized membrane-anchored protein
MNRISRAALTAAMAVCAATVVAAPASAPQSRDESMAAIRGLPWEDGPTTGLIGTRSKLVIPKDVSFLKETAGSKFLELTGNLPSPGSSILNGDQWWAVLNFSDLGYVKDDEKIDADALLKTIKEGDVRENEERRKIGLAELHTEGWYVPPHYDSETKHLEWGVKLTSSDSPRPIVNYSVRLLGRSGVESVVLVSSPEALDANVRSLKAILKGFEFNSGEKYSEFRPGDHVAEIGLGALVLGGAAAVAAKTGFWKVLLASLAAFWKVIVVGAAAVTAAIAKLFKRKQS